MTDDRDEKVIVKLPSWVPLHEAIAQLRRYDGKTDAAEYMERFEADLEILGYDKFWALMNIDRVLKGDAGSWHSSIWPKYIESLKKIPKAIDDAGQSDELWEEFKAGMLEFFHHKSTKQTHRQRNRELSYSFDKDPQSYVEAWDFATCRPQNDRRT